MGLPLNFGAGTFGAGLGLAGLGPLPPPVPPRQVSPPAALWFDGATQDFLLGSNGEYPSLDPVDQEVALALCLGLGTVPSVPGIGAAFRTITRITPRSGKTAEDMARSSLAALVSAGKIQIESVTTDANASGGTGKVLVEVAYINLITQRRVVFPPSGGNFTGT